MAPSRAPQEDVELGEIGEEHDAFLPNSNTSKQSARSSNILTRHLPPRLRDFLENLSKIKIAILLLLAFILLLTWVTLANRNAEVVIPEHAADLAEKLTKEMSETSIPDFVLAYAPLVFLDKADTYYPSDLAQHVEKTHPTLNFTTIEGAPKPLTLENLDKLNDLGGEDVYLTSTENAVKLPKFLHGKRPGSATLETQNAKSCVVIVVEKEDGIIDAFYMYFYTFNAGPTALGHTAGNHVGDWEHNMIRFENGLPTAVWYSQHEYGEAYSYKAVQKAGKRPISYSAKGSHANYVKAAAHDLHQYNKEIPAHIAYDYTSPGRLWDPILSAYWYTFSTSEKKFTPARENTPVNYLYFSGRWGDKEYEDDVEGQESFHGFRKWTSGPQGPLFKHLDRKDVCLPNRPECIILDRL